MKSKQVPTLNSRLLSFIVSNHRIISHISCRCAFTCHLISILRFQNSVNPVGKKKYKSKQAGLCFLENTVICWPETSAAPANVAFYARRTTRVDPGPTRNSIAIVEIQKCFSMSDKKRQLHPLSHFPQGSTLSKGLLATGHRLGPQTETFSWPCGPLPTHPWNNPRSNLQQFVLTFLCIIGQDPAPLISVVSRIAAFTLQMSSGVRSRSFM